MAAVTNATPLISLDAVVLDTETTGLDPRKARLIDAAAVRIAAGRIETKGTFQSYVNPREPIPAYSTEVHGIDDGKVSESPARRTNSSSPTTACRRPVRTCTNSWPSCRTRSS